MNAHTRFHVSWLLAALLIAFQFPRPTIADPAWTMTDLNNNVQLMKNTPAQKRDFLMVWELPSDFHFMYVSGAVDPDLGAKIDALAARGIVPTAHTRYHQSGVYTEEGVLAIALTLQNRGLPINVMAWVDDTNSEVGVRHWFWQANDPVKWVTDTGGDYVYESTAAAYRIPIIPLYDKTHWWKHYFKVKLEHLQAGGITAIDGVWQDYESVPYPWNGVYEAQKNNVSALSVYQALGIADVLATKDAFLEYTVNLKRQMLRESTRAAAWEVYSSGVPFGNYGAGHSSAAHPYYSTAGVMYPPITPSNGTWATPPIYATVSHILPFFTSSENIASEHDKVDDIYWFQMLRSFSSSAVNDDANDNLHTLPYVCSQIANVYATSRTGDGVTVADPTEWNDPANTRMSRDVYRELLRHIWLRGAAGMHVFTHVGSSPDVGIDRTPAMQFEEIEDARSVLDEMLNYRTFLENGIPINYAFANAYGAVDNDRTWSGLKYNSEAVIRVIDRSKAGYIFPINGVFGAETFALKAPDDGSGATYLVRSDGASDRIDPVGCEAYLPLDGDLMDETGNGHNGAWVSNTPDVPTDTYVAQSSQIIHGSLYGYVFNAMNTDAVEVRRKTSPVYYGTGVNIPNTNNTFDASAFTAEMFVSVGAGNTDDNGNLLGKYGAWNIRLRNNGAVELGVYFGVSHNTTWFRTDANILPHNDGLWRHLAVTYDNSTRQIKVYVDYQPLTWTQWRQGVGVNAQCILPDDLDYSVHGDISLGWQYPASRATNAYMDEFRFTSKVLEPGQFLRNP